MNTEVGNLEIIQEIRVLDFRYAKQQNKTLKYFE